MNSKALNNLNINTSKIVLNFGDLQKELKIIINNQLDSEIVLPEELTNLISLPDIPYEGFFKGNHLYLGPVIGFVPQIRYYNQPKDMLMRFADYENIKGLIFIFQSSGIDKTNRVIKGFYYNPISKSFIGGTFPYPNAIYNRTSKFEDVDIKYFRREIGDKIFYNEWIKKWNKWTFWTLLSKVPAVKRNIPESKLYDKTNLIEMLKKYNSVYLKPVNRFGGKGILFVKSIKNGYEIRDTFYNKTKAINEKDLNSILKKRINRKYIIQPEINARYPVGKVDFRVYFFKNEELEWYFAAMEAKIAPKDSIITNHQNRKAMLAGDVALKEILKFNKHKAQQVKDNIEALCITALKIVEKKGYHFGEAAIDLVIDLNSKIWLLELQTFFAAEIKALRTEDEKQVLPIILPAPFRYAKGLAGFSFTDNKS